MQPVLMNLMPGQDMLIVLLIVLVLFGGSKIPQLAKGLGEGMREFKKASKEDHHEVDVKPVEEKKE